MYTNCSRLDKQTERRLSKTKAKARVEIPDRIVAVRHKQAGIGENKMRKKRGS